MCVWVNWVMMQNNKSTLHGFSMFIWRWGRIVQFGRVINHIEDLKQILELFTRPSFPLPLGTTKWSGIHNRFLCISIGWVRESEKTNSSYKICSICDPPYSSPWPTRLMARLISHTCSSNSPCRSVHPAVTHHSSCIRCRHWLVQLHLRPETLHIRPSLHKFYTWECTWWHDGAGLQALHAPCN